MSALIERSGIDPADVGQVVGGCVSQVGEQAFNIARTAWLTAGLPLDGRRPPRSTRQCGSSQQATNLAAVARRRRASSTSPSACGVEVDEPRSRSASNVQGARLGIPIPKTYFAQLRDDVAVRGRRAHRRQVGHHPRRHRRVRPALASSAPRAAWAEGRFDAPDRRRSTRPTSTTTASRPARPTTSHATRACARRRSRSWPRSSRSPARTACTPPARRRRSPTAPPPCC